MTATEELMKRDPGLVHQQYKGYGAFEMADVPKIDYPAGIETEMGELLYGLVRWLKPEHILETGTRGAVAARYMCLGLEHNGIGHLITMERDGITGPIGRRKLAESGFAELVTAYQIDTRLYTPNVAFDLMWLDTEPQYRYAELVRFFAHLKPGGIVGIHDLGRLECEEFGGLPSEVIEWFYTGELRSFTFTTGWSCCFFQKAYEDDIQREIFRREPPIPERMT